MKFFNIKNIVGISILVLIAGITICLTKWDYMWEDEYLSKWASMITIISVGIVPAWYFWTKHQNEQDEKSRASKNLYIELDDTWKALQYEAHPDQFLGKNLKKGGIAKFMNRALNHDFYDSLVFSGKINFLPPEIQQEIQDGFQRIKDHNFYIRKIRDIEDYAYLHEIISLKTDRYYEMLDKTEVILLDEIPKLKEKLKEEFKFD